MRWKLSGGRYDEISPGTTGVERSGVSLDSQLLYQSQTTRGHTTSDAGYDIILVILLITAPIYLSGHVSLPALSSFGARQGPISTMKERCLAIAAISDASP
jgi:hypothetical protein